MPGVVELRSANGVQPRVKAPLLLVGVESWTALSGWFGDAGHLEVWMRASDLASRRFENTWCLIRTD